VRLGLGLAKQGLARFPADDHCGGFVRMIADAAPGKPDPRKA
jgi:hypothetical protein